VPDSTVRVPHVDQPTQPEAARGTSWKNRVDVSWRLMAGNCRSTTPQYDRSRRLSNFVAREFPPGRIQRVEIPLGRRTKPLGRAGERKEERVARPVSELLSVPREPQDFGIARFGDHAIRATRQEDRNRPVDDDEPPAIVGGRARAGSESNGGLGARNAAFGGARPEEGGQSLEVPAATLFVSHGLARNNEQRVCPRSPATKFRSTLPCNSLARLQLSEAFGFR
jgi:hypothetical protein